MSLSLVALLWTATAALRGEEPAQLTPSEMALQKILGAGTPDPLPLWPGRPPQFMENATPEVVTEEARLRNVSVPTISLYLPPPEKRTGLAVIVCAGGGYGGLDWRTHVAYAAHVFNAKGVAVIGLKYRTRPPHLVSNEGIQALTLLDAKRAVRLVRSRAAEWQLDPHKIGIVGYSAGANLAMNLAAKFDAGDPQAADPVERQSSRPDFAVGLGVWHWRKPVSPFHFPSNAPPVYLVHATTDKPLELPQQIKADLLKLGVPVRLDLFEEGGHGVGNLIPTRVQHGFPPAQWPELFLKWFATLAPGGKQATEGWKKFEGNPVLGGKYGTCFDISVLREDGKYRMWLSWRPKGSVALVESADGIHWSEPPQIVLGPRKETGWENSINRPCVLKRADGYHLWYTGQTKSNSWIGYATSPDGVAWKRMSDKPVLSAERPWERVAVMCPHVVWDAEAKLFRMWYSGGEQNEPNAIGYATSPDGLVWTKQVANPVFSPDPNCPWEKHKVTACQVEKRSDWHVMFYIGFRDEAHAQIGVARSRDGITNWQRLPQNPIVRPGANAWDHAACYKPYAIFDGAQWLLWYNGRHGHLEQIGVAFHAGEDLGFETAK